MGPLCSFKDLVLDANDVDAVGGFWARVLGREVHAPTTGTSASRRPGGSPDAGLTWIERVPEPRTAKTRVHLDLRLAACRPRPSARGWGDPAARTRRRGALVGPRRPGGQRVLRDAPRAGGVGAARRRLPDAVRARGGLRRPGGDRDVVGRGDRRSPRRAAGVPVPLDRGGPRLPLPVLGVRAGPGAQDREEPAALGRPAPRPRPVPAARGRGDACCESRTTRSAGGCSPTPRATSSAPTRPGDPSGTTSDLRHVRIRGRGARLGSEATSP